MQHETEGETVSWMSYAELGQARGTSAASAKRFANRKRWRKLAGNDGTVRVAVPAGGTVPRETATGTVPDLSHLLAEANKRADSAIALAHKLGAQLADAGERADRAEKATADERARIDRMAQELIAATRELDTARQRGEGLQRDLDAAETAASELRQRVAQLQEVAIRTERQAEAITADRQAADERVEALREEMDRLEHDRATAVSIADEAVRAAEQLRRTAMDGKGRGRWARLRAAWRGE